MSKEQPHQHEYSDLARLFGFIMVILIFVIPLGGLLLIINIDRTSDLKKTAIYQEIIYVGNDTFIQCINGHNTVIRQDSRFSDPRLIIAKNYTTPPLTNTPESCIVKFYNYAQKEKMLNNTSMIQVN